jgi:hypothetical protein
MRVDKTRSSWWNFNLIVLLVCVGVEISSQKDPLQVLLGVEHIRHFLDILLRFENRMVKKVRRPG